eukprot:scaffold1154_cov310-Pinguiococcus_pyrenoidosus.AAC.12
MQTQKLFAPSQGHGGRSIQLEAEVHVREESHETLLQVGNLHIQRDLGDDLRCIHIVLAGLTKQAAERSRLLEAVRGELLPKLRVAPRAVEILHQRCLRRARRAGAQADARVVPGSFDQLNGLLHASHVAQEHVHGFAEVAQLRVDVHGFDVQGGIPVDARLQSELQRRVIDGAEEAQEVAVKALDLAIVASREQEPALTAL